MYLTLEQFKIILDTTDVPIFSTPSLPEGKIYQTSRDVRIPVSDTPLLYSLYALSFVRFAQSEEASVAMRSALNFCSQNQVDDISYDLFDLSAQAYLIDTYELKNVEQNDNLLDGNILEIPEYRLPLSSVPEYYPYVLEYLKKNPKLDRNYSGEAKDATEVSISDLVKEYSERKEDGEKEKVSEKKERKGASLGSALSVEPIEDRDPIKEFELFLTLLIDSRKRFKPDSLKHYNRNSRGTRKFMYSSVKKVVKKGQIKLGILLDVSASIPVSIIGEAISSLNEVISLLDRESLVLAWDTEYQGSWDLYSIPSEMDCYGGTALSGGLLWFEERGFNTIVVFSDFVMTDTQTFYDISKRLKVHYYPINDESYEHLKDDMSCPKKCLSLYERVFRKV